eukprot:TRINITY_DN23174_c0_g1_i1.p1 TRINITY_DN23174_c0_g1~~TRINITY_DN23174_c0_g1_i1.p1  ORF type:complete len:173 (+),score=36.07 TRINITY_DN23174_c0_g1_i1:75-521(+)
MADSSELTGPARKMFIKQIKDLEGKKWKVEVDSFTNQNCITPMFGGSCSPAAEVARVWLQGTVTSVTGDYAMLSDRTGSIQFLVNEIEPDARPKPNSYRQVVGKLALSGGSPSPLFILTELCADIPASSDESWTLEVLDFQSKCVFTS